MDALDTSFFLLQKSPLQLQIGKPLSKEEQREKEEKAILCKNCHGAVTSQSSVIEVNGKHQHSFFNPAGLIYEIGCFSDAGGCITYGDFSYDFSWFPGYARNYALCKSCLLHLGWYFHTENKKNFFGLIKKYLIEA